ncbi:unnamed protein product [Rodentolepis nana]|uniref:SRCR domain-containing protein n=1 Tax=Rodentolepis nana TaxID=102285 RepID=A0A0R3TBV3_RODNA|nr:unnamed protein product [Rodentolepis nana]
MSYKLFLLLNCVFQIQRSVADDGYCQNALFGFSNSSKWCNVELEQLVDSDYKPIVRPLCMEKKLANEVFNVTCSKSVVNFASFQALYFVTGCVICILLLVALWVLIRKSASRKQPYDAVNAA